MNKRLLLLLRVLFATLIIFFLGCNKIIDVDDLLHHQKEVELCKIQKITSYSAYSNNTGPLVATFEYNHRGDPVSVNFSEVATGRPNLVWRYDKHGKLTDYAGPYTNGVYEFWRHYQYSGDRIVSDTMYAFGNIVNGVFQPSTSYGWVDQYEYDLFGRVIKVNQRFLSPSNSFPVEVTFKYDNNGNLATYRIFFDGVLESEQNFNSYDNKINLRRTSEVWLFTDMNYSVNNIVKATSYNSFGLPLGFDTKEFFYFLYQYDITNSTIEYKCK